MQFSCFYANPSKNVFRWVLITASPGQQKADSLVARCKEAGYWCWDKNFPDDKDEIEYLVYDGIVYSAEDAVTNQMQLEAKKELARKALYQLMGLLVRVAWIMWHMSYIDEHAAVKGRAGACRPGKRKPQARLYGPIAEYKAVLTWSENRRFQSALF